SAYAVALQAYRHVIGKFPESPRAIQAYSGAISTLFNMAFFHSQQQFAEQAFQLIDSVSIRFQNHPELPHLKYLEGLFYLEYYFDVDRAVDIFSDLLKATVIAPNRRDETILKLGECYILKGKLNKALDIFNQVSTKPYQDDAALYSARVYYFQKEWKKSSQSLQNLVQQLGAAGDVVNDALALQMKIAFSQSVPDILGSFSEAELLEYQRKNSEAVKKFSEITSRDSVPPVMKSESYLKAVKLSLELNEPLQAAEYCQKAISDTDILPYTDKHLFLLAGILKNSLNKPEEAYNIYLEILQNYPNSLMADRARDELRTMNDIKGVEFP
ncbi:MAG: hypothetical protein EH225_00770, partial [Calditrichaeota bacterium]